MLSNAGGSMIYYVARSLKLECMEDAIASTSCNWMRY